MKIRWLSNSKSAHGQQHNYFVADITTKIEKVYLRPSSIKILVVSFLPVIAHASNSFLIPSLGIVKVFSLRFLIFSPTYHIANHCRKSRTPLRAVFFAKGYGKRKFFEYQGTGSFSFVIRWHEFDYQR